MAIARQTLDTIRSLGPSPRAAAAAAATFREPRCLSVEQALIITEVYRRRADEPRVLQRAAALAASLSSITLRIDAGELIVGNRTAAPRSGIVFPEAGIRWVLDELEELPTREQDPFQVRPDDRRAVREILAPFWLGRTLEDRIRSDAGPGLDAMARVVKINQKDHAQGHICPDAAGWLHRGPRGLLERVRAALVAAGSDAARLEYRAMTITLEGAIGFMERYADLAARLADDPRQASHRTDLLAVARTCRALAARPPLTFHEALQSLWFLFVVLQAESNASSFSPGRIDQYLLPYLERDLAQGTLDLPGALELLECLWVKFNQVVYLRNAHSARYFAGFPIGFNVAIGGQTADGRDAANILSFLCLKAQEHLGTPQPNLSARLFRGSDDQFVRECARVIGHGGGMPQLFNDESVIPSLLERGFERAEAVNYAIVGCVELSTHGSTLGWSDAAMFNLVKVLELAVHDGECQVDHRRIGLRTGRLEDHADFEALLAAYRRQVDHFMDLMFDACEVVERAHREMLPTPFLSTVVDACIARGLDVVDGGATYNFSGIQAIQVANLADSLAALKRLVYEERAVSPAELREALAANFEGREPLRQKLMNRAPKYGNDVPWVDELGAVWVRHVAGRLAGRVNHRGGRYHMGLYTVSAHVPMGGNVGATPDGRRSGQPLADGGLSAVYGRDRGGPTALLNSVARMESHLASNGTLLNMKFLPERFLDGPDFEAFIAFLRGWVEMPIHHVQFNVVRPEDLVRARQDPEAHRSLTIRVAGYTAYFTDLSADLQDEIIARTTYPAGRL